MYLCITRGHFDLAAVYSVDAQIGHLREALGRLPGHDHTHIGIDRAAGQVVAVTLWDTDAHARFAGDRLGALLEQVNLAFVTVDAADVYAIAGE
jgi:hypothetical protein